MWRKGLHRTSSEDPQATTGPLCCQLRNHQATSQGPKSRRLSQLVMCSSNMRPWVRSPVFPWKNMAWWCVSVIPTLGRLAPLGLAGSHPSWSSKCQGEALSPKTRWMSPEEPYLKLTSARPLPHEKNPLYNQSPQSWNSADNYNPERVCGGGSWGTRKIIPRTAGAW